MLFFFLFSDEDGEKSVSILLDGEESTLEFVDLSDDEVSNFIIKIIQNIFKAIRIEGKN